MPRVLRIMNRFNLGGPTYNAAYLTRYLQPDFQTLLVGGRCEESEASSEYILKDLGIDYQIIPEMTRSVKPGSDYRAYRKICSLIDSFKPDLVHTHASKAGALGRMAAIRKKVPVRVHTFHGHIFESYFSKTKTLAFKTIEQYLARHTTSIIALSQKQKDDLEKVLKINDPSKIRIIPLGFDLDKFREDTETKRKRFRDRFHLEPDVVAIGIVGRLVPVKNHALFIKAVKHLSENSSTRFKAFIIGDGEERTALEKMAAESGILFETNDVKEPNAVLNFTSWITEMDRVMAGLDIVVLTSHNEGTPVSLIEAQAAGKPVVSTRVGGIENMVWEGTTALLSNPGEEEGFFSNLLSLTGSPLLRQEMSREGWNFVEHRFHYKRLVNDMREHYMQLIYQKGKAGLL